MSVRVGDRNLSRIEFLAKADKLYDSIFDLTSRYFGIYSRHSPFRSKYNQCIKFKSKEEIEEFVKSKANDLEIMASDLRTLLAKANKIYPKSKIEYDLRLNYVTQALACTNSIKTTLNLVVKYFDLDLNVFRETVLLMNDEIDLIKSLRRSDRKRFGQLL